MAPVWGVQLAWSPSAATLSIDYNSSNPSAPVNGAYQGTPAVTAQAGWQQHTWKLTDVAFGDRENFGADLRLSGSPGVAVRSVVLSLRPPGPGAGPQASLDLTSGSGQGITQVGAGGRQGDSFYHVARVGGASAEVLDDNAAAGPGAPSYIYLRLDASSALAAEHPTVVYVTVTYTALHPAQPWNEETFAGLAAKGVRTAEINLEWSAIEPERGRFDFSLLDADLANAARAGVKLVPIFWYSVWQGNPAGWVTAYDAGSSGAVAQVPVWWDPSNRQAYFEYVRRTVAQIKASAAFGGAFLDYGWLDYVWGPAPGGTGVDGYAAADVAEFHRWLPTQYRSLAAFNAEYQTAYRSWAAVPAARPGEGLFPVYQRFRDWSVQDTYAELSRLYRRETDAPLYYYWGGDLGGAGVAFNVPDTFFQVAREYGGTVVFDDAESTGLALLFQSLAEAYGVPLLLEWTPAQSGLQAEMAQFLGHYGFEAPEIAGMDFFLYGGGQEYDVGFPEYVRWIPVLTQVHGAYPRLPVAVYFSYAVILQRPDALSAVSGDLQAIWQKQPQGFAVVTDRELAAGVARLSQFKAVYPLTGASDAAVEAYARQGGHVLTDPAQLAESAPAYARLQPTGAGLVEIVPVVDASARSAWVTVAGVSPAWSYQGRVTIDPSGLGLPAGQYRLLDARTGQDVPADPGQGGTLTVPLSAEPGSLVLWHLVPGAGPSLPGAVGGTGGGAAQPVSFTAGGSVGGMQVLNVTAPGGKSTGDGNVSLVRQEGEAAVETWTTKELGTPAAYLYLQVDPSSPLYTADRLELTVTYLATPGQGFQVQYGGAAGAYTNGPTVTSPGSGQWATVQVEIDGVHLDEAENGGADLRLFVRDGAAPLYVHAVTLSAAAGV